MREIIKNKTNISVCKNIKEFAKSIEHRIIWYWVYKRGYTPYEEEQKFSDQSIYEEPRASKGIITEIIVLPDNDLLLGIATIYEYLDEIDENLRIEYLKLSEIRLYYNEDCEKELINEDTALDE